MFFSHLNVCVCDCVCLCVFSTGDVEFDIESLYKAVPQLAKVFRIIDKIGEGQCEMFEFCFTFGFIFFFEQLSLRKTLFGAVGDVFLGCVTLNQVRLAPCTWVRPSCVMGGERCSH